MNGGVELENSGADLGGGAAGPAKSRRVNWGAVAYWAGCFLARMLGIVVAGAVIGAVTFPLGGLFINTGRTAWELVAIGARFLSFIFGIWAPAVAMVLCVMKAWNRNAARERAGAVAKTDASEMAEK